MSTRVDLDDIQVTRSEKLLALVLGVFLLIGGLWIYDRLDRRDPRVFDEVRLERPGEAAAIERHEAARGALAEAEGAELQARENLELRREAYRTALDASQASVALERRYRQAESGWEAARAQTAEAGRRERAARTAAQAAGERIAAEVERREDRARLLGFLLRLGFVLGCMAFAFWILARLRNRGSRYTPVGFALVGFAAVQALVLAGDYTTDYLDVEELGPVVLSLAGIGMTLASFVALQRYLVRRMPRRRVRKRECPFCGYPVLESEHCEGCGRDVVAACSTCGEPRRVGTLHCGACGRA